MYYPLKDLFGELGEAFCHFFAFLEIDGAFVGQFHSFFMTVYRYICLFHSDELLQNDITPKVIDMIQSTKINVIPLVNKSNVNGVTWIQQNLSLKCC